MKKPKTEKRSPLKAKPLRNPGQSLDEKLDDVIMDEAIPWIVMSAFVVALTFYEFSGWYFHLPRQPIGTLFVAVVVIGLSVYKIIKVKKKADILRLGRDGEKAVGQYLERLREKGYKIFHDIQGDGFNIDHVIIGHQGVFTIETKTHSMPVGRKPVVRCKDGVITVDGHFMDRDPIGQAKAQASWLRDVLESSTGQSSCVKPVLVFPGWFIECKQESGRNEVWVLNPKALPKFIENEPTVLEPKDIAMLAHHLTLHIRANA